MAIADETLRAIITVEDRTAAGLHAINQRFAAFTAPLREIRKHAAEIGKEVGFVRLGEHAKSAFEHVRRLHGAVTSILAPLGALSALASIGGIAEAVKAAADYGEHTFLTARSVGLTAPQLGGFEYAGRLANIPQEQADRGIQYFNRQIAEAARGKNKDVEIILSRMGLANTPQHMVDTASGLRAVSAEAKKLVDSGQVQLASDMMGKLFGSRSGVLLLPLFAQGPEHLAELAAQAAATGQSMTDAQAAAAAKFAESYKQMDGAVIGLRNSIANALFPVLTPIIESMTRWISANRGWLASNIGDAARSLRAINWKGVGADLRAVGADALWLIDRVGGIGPALGIIAAIRFAPAILAFGQLGVTAVAVLGRIILAMGIATAAVWRLGMAGKIVAGASWIGLIGLAAYEIYEHWDTIEPWIEGVLNKLVEFSKWAWQQIRADAGPAIDWIWQKWSGFTDWLTAHVPASVARLWTGGALSADQLAGFRQLGGGGPMPLPAQRTAVARQLLAHAEALGLDRPHALAMLANAEAESGFNAGAVGDHGTSLGLFQEHNERAAAMLAALGKRATDPTAQFDYAWNEMKKRDPGWFRRSDDLTNSFEKSFERPRNVTDRSAYFDQLSQSIGRSTPVPASPKMQGRIDVTVNHHNPPPGTTASVMAQGSDDLDLNLGQAFGW